MANNIIVDHETHKFLVELGFYETSILNPTIPPMWWQVKEWLFDNKDIHISIYHIDKGYNYHGFARNIHMNKGYNSSPSYDSPIIAEIETIKKTIKHLHEKHLIRSN